MFRLLRNTQLLRAAQFQSNFIKQKSTTTHSHAGSSPSSVDAARTRDSGLGAAAASPSGKLPAREPLVKNFFVGVVDKELLAYPEVVPREDMSKLQNELLPLKSFFAEEVDANAMDATRSVPSAVLEQLRQLGLYGTNVPIDYNGKCWGWSESLIAAEPESSCPNVAMGLLSHRVVIDVLREIGTLEQQQRYLEKLASGALVGTEAIFENPAPEYDFFNTTAERNPDTGTWQLNGEKAFVVTGPLAPGSTPLLLVIAQTQRLNMKADSGRSTTIFLVDATTEGVKLGEQHLTIGFRGLQMRHVRFDQVVLPDSCILGGPNDGNQVADLVLRSSRLRSSMVGLGMARQHVNALAQYCVDNKQCGVALKDMEVTKTHLAKVTCATYAMESMIYLTAGLLDEFSRQDVAMEAAITKYFTFKQLFKMSSKNMDMIGPKSLHSGESTEVAFRNAAQLYTQNESIDSLRLSIAFSGIQHAGVLIQDSVHKSRNPLFHPMHIFGKFLQSSSIENPNTKMRLADNLHPSLEQAAQCIEHSVARLQMCVEVLLTRFGNTVIERHTEMERFAEMSTTIYAMFASVSRASRSYCIGLQLADHEMLTATSVCVHGRDLVRTLCTEVFNGTYVNNDNNLLRLSNQVLKSKGYFAQHPLKFNF